MPHKIVFLIGSLDRGGTEGQLVELATRLPRDKFACEIWCLNHRGVLANTAEAKGIPVRTFGSGTLYGLLEVLLRVTMALRITKPCIVHGFLFESYIAAALCGWLAGVPVRIQSRRSLGIFKEKRRVCLLVERISSWFTHAVVANCDAVAFDTKVREPWLSFNKLTVIYNGVDMEKFKPRPNELRQAIRDPKFRIISVCLVANLIHYKRVDRFLKIAERLHWFLPEARFLILGGGPCEQNIKLSMPKTLAPFVTFAGQCSGTENVLPYQDVCLLTSDQEGFPNAALEAMACGAPVVASNVGGVPELIHSGRNGYTIKNLDDLGEWLGCVLDVLGKGKHLDLSLAARRTAEQFSVQCMVSEYDRLYLNLLEANIVK
jgi:glycosyltransferase involved in cell wall biosynthesis